MASQLTCRRRDRLKCCISSHNMWLSISGSLLRSASRSFRFLLTTLQHTYKHSTMITKSFMQWRPGVRSLGQISSDYAFFCLWKAKKQFYHFAKICHSAVAPPSAIKTKLNVHTQLQTVPFQWLFTYWWQSGIHKLSFKSMTDKQRNKKHYFLCKVRPAPSLAWW